MDEIKKQYMLLLSEIIANMMVIFGSDVAISKAQSISGLVVDDSGKVTDIKGYATEKTDLLVKSYKKLFDKGTSSLLDAIFKKYPQVKRQ